MKISTKVVGRLTAVQRQFLALGSKNPVYHEMMAFAPEMYADVIQLIPDADLKTLMSVTRMDAGVLFNNLEGLHSSTFQTNPKSEDHKSDWDRHLASLFSSLASAFRDEDDNWMDRLTNAWVCDWLALPKPTRWQEQRAEKLCDIQGFSTEYEKIQHDWPPNLNEFRNTTIPTFLSYLVDPQKPLVGRRRETRPELDKPYPPTFIEAARRFVRKWNIKSLRFRAGKHTFILPAPWCASDAHGQGTWAFIPAHYSFTSIHKTAKEDFTPLAKLLAESYEIFEPGKRTLEEKKKACRKYVDQELAGTTPTKQSVTDHVHAWCLEKVMIEKVLQARVGSDNQEREYLKDVLQYYGL
jgi:hypothetical protein